MGLFGAYILYRGYRASGEPIVFLTLFGLAVVTAIPMVVNEKIEARQKRLKEKQLEQFNKSYSNRQHNCARYLIEYYTTKLASNDLEKTFAGSTTSTIELSSTAKKYYMDTKCQIQYYENLDKMVKTEIYDYWKNDGIDRIETSYTHQYYPCELLKVIFKK